MADQIGKLSVGLRAENGVKLKGLAGEALHALFFRIIRQNYPELAFKIHNQEEQKPFSLTPPLGDVELRQGYTVISAGTTLTFGLAFLTEELLVAGVSALINAMKGNQTLMLLRTPVILESLDLSKGRFSSFSNMLTDASSSPIITLGFLTPTSFRKNEIQVTFPQPELVFSSLLRRWNAFSDSKLPEEHIPLFNSIKVSSYDLHTELVNFSRYKIIGFKGKVMYELPKDASEDFLRAANVLADFALFSGVGAKTAMGMGQVQRIN